MAEKGILANPAPLGLMGFGMTTVLLNIHNTDSVAFPVGSMILAMGIITIIFYEQKMKFSWKRIISLGVLGGFNKGISGGGFGPLMVSGQMVSGRNGKQAIASTLVAETIASVVGVFVYIIANVLTKVNRTEGISWESLELAPYSTIGAIIAAPIAAFFTKRVDEKKLKLISGITMIILGVLVLIRIILLRLGVWVTIPDFVEGFTRK